MKVKTAYNFLLYGFYANVLAIKDRFFKKQHFIFVMFNNNNIRELIVFDIFCLFLFKKKYQAIVFLKQAKSV